MYKIAELFYYIIIIINKSSQKMQTMDKDLYYQDETNPISQYDPSEKGNNIYNHFPKHPFRFKDELKAGI